MTPPEYKAQFMLILTGQVFISLLTESVVLSVLYW